MAIRKYTNPRDLDLSPGLQDVLRRNGMQAHMAMQPNGQSSSSYWDMTHRPSPTTSTTVRWRI